jgi:hypothetical protein
MALLRSTQHQQPFTGPCPQPCHLTNGRAGGTAGAQYKRRPLKSTTSICGSLQGVTSFDYTSERSNQSATHQKGGTSFNCMATLPSRDRALHCWAEAMPISASSPPGTQCYLLTQQPAAQMQPTAQSLPAISSTVASPAANQLSQPAQQHQAASPHCGPLMNSRMQQTHL